MRFRDPDVGLCLGAEETQQGDIQQILIPDSLAQAEQGDAAQDGDHRRRSQTKSTEQPANRA